LEGDIVGACCGMPLQLLKEIDCEGQIRCETSV
jgi:hypothetical protein